MSPFYWTFLLLLIPAIGGFVAWLRCREIVIWEWAAGFGITALMLAMVFGISLAFQGKDYEVRSGYVYQAHHTPWWHAEWEELETYTTTDSKGNVTTHTRLVTKTRTYPPSWWVETTIGSIYVSEETFDSMAKRFGLKKELGSRPDMDEGDPYDYWTDINNPDPEAVIYPVHSTFAWDNPFLDTKTIQIGEKVTKEEAARLKLHSYPEAGNAFVSGRVINAPVSTYKWDQMCAAIGAKHRVNLTLINFGDRDMAAAVKQRDYWVNGKKNDLVLCYGKGWSYVFGWSKTELVKQELQTVLLENEVNDSIIPLIKEVVIRDFEPYAWKSEERIPRPVPTAAVVIAFLLTVGAQVGLFILFRDNGVNKDSSRDRLVRFA